jgi:hypothetical protein
MKHDMVGDIKYDSDHRLGCCIQAQALRSLPRSSGCVPHWQRGGTQPPDFHRGCHLIFTKLSELVYSGMLYSPCVSAGFNPTLLALTVHALILRGSQGLADFCVCVCVRARACVCKKGHCHQPLKGLAGNLKGKEFNPKLDPRPLWP